MDKLILFLIFSSSFNFSTANPLNVDKVTPIRRRGEHKNWKVESGYYDKTYNNQARDDPPSTYRLPNDTLPVRYDIHLTTDVDKSNFNFSGLVRIRVRAVEETSIVTLHYRDITVSKVTLIDVASGNVLVDELNFRYVEVYEFLKIQLPRTLNVHEEVLLEIPYNGILKENNAGFYRAWYTENGKTIYYAVTQFESTDARHAFPCYDEPAIRTPIGLQIQHDKSYNADSNMPLISKIPVEGTDYVISKFDDTPPMQTYLLAFLVSPFDFVSTNDDNIPQRILAKPASIASGDGDFAVNIADSIIKTFVNHFDVNYTLPKLDHAAITQFAAGAMENWGLVTYREQYLLFVPSNNPVKDESAKRGIIATIAHEDAHQWFGNLVSPHWWSDLWMNEGFATLYEYYIPHLLYPNDGWMEEFRMYEINFCFGYDILSSRRAPMHYYVETPAAIDGRFDSISYSKSGVVLYMFQQTLSVPTFTKGLSKYLRKMYLKAAVPNDLFSSIQEAYNEDYPSNPIDIIKAMESWVYQAGYPLIQVEKTSSGSLRFTQRRYPGSDGEIYRIPVSYASENRMNFEDTRAGIWLNEEVTIVSKELLGVGESDWIILNIQQTGYYRVTYSGELWQAIGKKLQQNHTDIHLVNRRVLQNELKIGYADLQNILASDVLEVERYLANEEVYEVWADAGSNLKSLNTTLFGTSAYSHFLKFIQEISRKQLNRIGMEALEGEPTNIRNLRNQVKTYNCYALDEDCLSHELEKLMLYRKDSALHPVPDFCSAFRNANILIYSHYLNELAENPELPYRSRIASSIGCSLNEMWLDVAVSVVNDQENLLTDPERVEIINNMLISSTVGFKVAFDYIESNPEKISFFHFNLATAVNTQAYHDRLKKILDIALAENFITESNAELLKSSISTNLDWQRKHLSSVIEFFEGPTQDSTTTELWVTDSTTQIVTSTTPGSANQVILSVAAVCLWVVVQVNSY